MRARNTSWRTFMRETREDSSKLWQVENWARLRSFLPVTPPKLLDLLKADGLPASSHQEKATLLQQRFFPNPEASPPPDNALRLNLGINISWEVTPEDIQAILSRIMPWKAPGIDDLSAGFLKAYGEPLAKVLAILATKCFKLEWFPKGLKRAKVIILQKLGKETTAYKTARGYRLITLLPNIGKLIEAIIAARTMKAAEEHGLLLEKQMGNR